MSKPSQSSTLRSWLTAILVFSVLLSSCTLSLDQLLSGQPDQDKPQDRAAGETESEQPEISQPTQTPSDTPEPPTPTFTPSPTASLTPTITLTPTPYVDVSQNTNCRLGPGSIYDLLHTYMAGEQALLLGKNAAEDFWYTKDPAGANPDCWLWGKFATPVGDTASLPIFTPPPTPTPYLDFSVNYEGSDCGAGSCGFWFKVDNTGIMPLESAWVHVKNTATSADSTYSSNLFLTGIMGADIANVPISGTGYTRSNLIPNPVGATVNASIKVCSQNGLGGVCLLKTVVINP